MDCIEVANTYIVDFEQPRALWEKVFDETQKAHYVSNVAGHIKNVKSKEVVARQRTFLRYLPFLVIDADSIPQ